VKKYGTFEYNFKGRFNRNKVKVFSYTTVISRNVFKLTLKKVFLKKCVCNTPFLNTSKEIYHEKSSFRQDRRSFALGSEQDEFRPLSKYFLQSLQAHKSNDFWITSVSSLLTFTDQFTEVMPLTRI